MTPTQVEYFLAAARCLNFTEAARRLHITQPALSRQISAIEAELNMQLFIRIKKTVRLTPAGQVLLIKLPACQDLLSDAIKSAQNANYGLTGQLRIGILDGQNTSELFPSTFSYFSQHYPNIQLSMERHSFREMREGLADNRLDLAVTLSFDIENCPDLHVEMIEESRTYVAVPRTHRLSGVNKALLADFQDDLFILISPEDSEAGTLLSLDTFKMSGIMPSIKYAPTLQTMMLWVESGIGIAILNDCNALADNPLVKFIEVEGLLGTSVVFAWCANSRNHSIALFIDLFKMNNKKT